MYIRDVNRDAVWSPGFQPCHVSPEEQLVQSKVETFTVEGYNSILRHFLAKLRRKSKCYSKTKHMLIHSLKLLMFKRNNNLAILY